MGMPTLPPWGTHCPRPSSVPQSLYLLPNNLLTEPNTARPWRKTYLSSPSSDPAAQAPSHPSSRPPSPDTTRSHVPCRPPWLGPTAVPFTPPPPPCPGPGLHRAARPRAGPLPSPSPPRRRGARRAAGPLASPPPPATRWSTRTGPWRARSPFPCLAAAGRAGRSRRSPPAATGRAGPIPGRAAPSSGGLRSGRHLPVASRPNARPAHQPAPPSRSPLASSSPAAGPIREALCSG